MSTISKITPKRLLINMKQMSLLKHSCLLLNTDIYGNLLDCLQFYDKLYDSEFNSDLRFDSRARSVVNNNLKVLIDDAQREWMAVSMSDETDKDIYCTLCGTKNIHIYFIKNSISGEEINVGANCASDFPGFLNIKEVRKNKKEEDQRQLKRKRELEFDEKISSDINFANNARDKFDAFELLLPHKLYNSLKSVIQQINFIRTSYINNGGDLEDAILRRDKLKNTFNTLWEDACIYKSKYLNDPFSCPKYLSDWLIKTNKNVWEEISLNNGLLNCSTIQSIYNMKYITDHLLVFKEHIVDQDINLAGTNGNNIVFSFKNSDYNNPIYFMISAKIFMQSIGANCLTNAKYMYTKADFITFQLMQSHENLANLVDHLVSVMKTINYNIEEDIKVHQYFLVKLASKKDLRNKWGNRSQLNIMKYKPINDDWIYKTSAKILFCSITSASKILDRYLSNITSGWMTSSEKETYIGIAASAAAMSKQSDFIPYV